MRGPSLRVSSLLIVFSVLLASDCATITRRSTQRIPVTSDPVGATVIVDGVQQGITPLEIRLVRKDKFQVIRIESPGYNPVEIEPRRKMSDVPIAGNVLLGVIPGMVPAIAYSMEHDDDENVGTISTLIWVLSAAVFGGIFTVIDTTSKGYELQPRELMVTLTKAEGPLRVNTIVIDAEDFRNIKWIRVHRD